MKRRAYCDIASKVYLVEGGVNTRRYLNEQQQHLGENAPEYL
jgi:hypothetical protein